MQFFLDFLPIVVFFVAYKIAGMYVATAAIIVVMVAQLAIQWLRKREVSKMLLASTAIVIVLGSITLTLRNPLFIQWKPTIVYWIFGAALLVSHYVGKETLIQRTMGRAISLPAKMWRQLSWFWIIYFAILGVANLYVVYNYSEDIWVNYKLFGTLVFTVVMVIAQTLWIVARTSHQPEQTDADDA